MLYRLRLVVLDGYRGVRYAESLLDEGCADNDLLTTQKEFSILLMLARNIGSTVPKAELYENVWGLPYSDNANALFTAVSRLNKKLDDNKADVTITYERGKGYALESI